MTNSKSPWSLFSFNVSQRLPILSLCASISFVAGMALESMLEGMMESSSGAALVSLVALSPVFNAQGGSSGGIFASRVATYVEKARKQRETDPSFKLMSSTHGSSVPPILPWVPSSSFIIEFLVMSASITTVMTGVFLLLWVVMGVSLAPSLLVSVGMTLTLSVSSLLSYYTVIFCSLFELDPDNVGVPLVCACMDLLSSLSFMFIIAMIAE